MSSPLVLQEPAKSIQSLAQVTDGEKKFPCGLINPSSVGTVFAELQRQSGVSLSKCGLITATPAFDVLCSDNFYGFSGK